MSRPAPYFTTVTMLGLGNPWDISNWTVNWTDISQWVRGGNTSMGAQHELDNVIASTLALKLDNRDSRFTTWNTISPYTTANFGGGNGLVPENTVWVFGVTADTNLLSTDDSSFDNSTGSYSNVTNVAGLAQSSTIFQGTKSLQVVGTSTGLTTISSTTYNCIPGKTYTISAYFKTTSVIGDACTVGIEFNDRDSSSGTSYLYTSPPVNAPSGSWTRVTYTVVAPAITYSMQIRLSSTLTGAYFLVDAVQVELASSASTWVAGSGPGIYPLYYGFVNSWVPEWESLISQDITVSCTDIFGMFTTCDMSSSGVEKLILSMSPLSYYTFGEISGSTYPLDSATPPNASPVFTGTGYTFGNPAILACDVLPSLIVNDWTDNDGTSKTTKLVFPNTILGTQPLNFSTSFWIQSTPTIDSTSGSGNTFYFVSYNVSGQTADAGAGFFAFKFSNRYSINNIAAGSTSGTVVYNAGKTVLPKVGDTITLNSGTFANGSTTATLTSVNVTNNVLTVSWASACNNIYPILYGTYSDSTVVLTAFSTPFVAYTIASTADFNVGDGRPHYVTLRMGNLVGNGVSPGYQSWITLEVDGYEYPFLRNNLPIGKSNNQTNVSTTIASPVVNIPVDNITGNLAGVSINVANGALFSPNGGFFSITTGGTTYPGYYNSVSGNVVTGAKLNYGMTPITPSVGDAIGAYTGITISAPSPTNLESIKISSAGNTNNLAHLSTYVGYTGTNGLVDHDNTNSIYVVGREAFVINTADVRIKAVLDNQTVPSDYYNLQACFTTLQPAATTLVGTDVFSYIQSVANSENGYMWQDQNGVIQLKNRHYTFQSGSPAATVQATFANAAPGNNTSPYPFLIDQFTPGFDNLDLWNQILVSANPGPTYGNVPIPAGTVQTFQDFTSQAKYGKRTLSKTGLLVNSDLEARYIAWWLGAMYSSPLKRVRSIKLSSAVNSGGTLSQQLGRNLYDKIAIQYNSPTGATVFNQNSLIEGIEQDWTAEEITTVFRLAPTDVQPWFVLDDPVNGALGTGKLAY